MGPLKNHYFLWTFCSHHVMMRQINNNHSMETVIMERKINQLSFLDSLIADLGGRCTAEFFEKCDKLIPWQQLSKSLKDMYRNNTDKGGAGNWPIVMMIKCMMLQKWFNLSYPMLKETLNDRISFRRFVGLKMEQKAPDETTFVEFRRRLREHGNYKR